MESEIDNSLYKSLSIVLIVSILLTLTLNLYMREKIRQSEGFSELYINDHRNLPKDMVIGETYNVSFTFTNNEITPETYTYEVDSPLLNYKRNITLSVGESAKVTVSLTPTNGSWGVTMSSETTAQEIITKTQSSSIPIQSYTVSGFGEILHENITYDEIAANPPNRYTTEYSLDSNLTQIRQANYTLKAADGNIVLEKNEKITSTINAPRPFILKVYKTRDKKGEELEVHFWHQIN